MKGLLLKDLFVLKGYGKQYIIIFGGMFVYSLCVKSATFVMIYFVLMGSSMVLSSMSMDEAVSFNKFALTMPVNMRMVIKSKYALFLITVGIGIVLSELANIFIYLFSSGGNEMFGWEGLAVTLAVFMVANAFTFPFMFRLGVEKARYVNIFSMVTIGGIIIGGVKICEAAGISFDAIEKIPTGILSVACAFVAALALGISYCVSVRTARNVSVRQ